MSEIPPPTVPPATPPPPGSGSYTPPPPPPPPPGGGPGPSPSSDRTLMLVLSYLGLFALIPLLTKKDDPEIQWHAKNGLALAIVLTVIWIPIWIMVKFIPFLGCLVLPIACLFPLIIIGVAIYLISQALNGKRVRIPLVSDLAEKINI